MYDVIVVGNGPAGLSAALYTSRANLKTLVIGKDKGVLENVEKIDNYFGTGGTISGCELIDNGIRQVQELGAELISDQVFAVSESEHFTVTGGRGSYEARSVILATGAGRKSVSVKGIRELEGRGVSYCAICDAFFYRGKDVAVLGNEAYAVHELEQLLPVAASVTLLTHGQELKAEVPESVRVIKEPLIEITGTDRVEGVRFADGSTIPIAGVFVALGSAGAVDLARKIGADTDGKRILVDEKMQTDVPGLFAAGDCIGGLLQISSAVGEGAVAAMSAMRYVRTAKAGENT